MYPTNSSSPQTSTSSKQVAHDQAYEQDTEQESISRTSLSSREQQFLLRVTRFLVNIQSTAYVNRARREGYTAKEHQEGWQLCREAAGANRPLDHWFAETKAAQSSNGNPERMALLQELDYFENTWFPRTRAIIRRALPSEKRDLFTAAFFQNLEQQPLGPGVINSVATYIGRVEGLGKSNQPEAQKILTILRERGLTDAKLQRIKNLLTQMETLGSPTLPPPVSPEEIARAQAAQMQALSDLHDWFNDWATTLRAVFNTQEQNRLGLIIIHRKESSTASDPSEEGVKENVAAE